MYSYQIPHVKWEPAANTVTNSFPDFNTFSLLLLIATSQNLLIDWGGIASKEIQKGSSRNFRYCFSCLSASYSCELLSNVNCKEMSRRDGFESFFRKLARHFSGIEINSTKQLGIESKVIGWRQRLIINYMSYRTLAIRQFITNLTMGIYAVNYETICQNF